MNKYDAKSIRNVSLLAHGGVGKTSLLEAACFTSKGTPKLGSTAQGTSIFDVRPDEKSHNMTISMKLGFCEWENTKINFLDSPGFLDLLGEAQAALRVTETACMMVSAVDGIQVVTELLAGQLAQTPELSRIFFINSCDRENADFDKVYNQLKEEFGKTVALTIPINEGPGFKAIVDVYTKEAYEYAVGGPGIGKKIEVPSSLKDKIATLRNQLVESVAETDETLMNTYFDKGELTADELAIGLAKGVCDGTIFPVMSGSATANIGVDRLLDYIAKICPSPEKRKEVTVMENGSPRAIPCGPTGPTAAFVFKTISEDHVGELNLVRVFCGTIGNGLEVSNVERRINEKPGNISFVRGREKIATDSICAGDIGGLLKLKDTHTNDTLADKSVAFHFPPIAFPEPLVRVAIVPKNKGEDDKLAIGITKLHQEDISFSYKFEPDIHQSILSAMGDVHIDIILEALKTRFKIEVEKKIPKISYRETITRSAKYIEYTHKKQSGGAGQYARVFIDLEPMPRGGGYEFIDKIVGGVIDQSFRPSVDKGVHSKLVEGILAGYPIVDVRVTLVDGKTHPVDSKDVAFQVAGREVFKKAFEMSSPILLEPIVNLTVIIPDNYMGDVMGDLSSRRGKISGMEPLGKYQVVKAKVPEAEIQTYSQTLRSITQGRGVFTKTFSHYDPVPHEVANKIIEAAKKDTITTEEA